MRRYARPPLTILRSADAETKSLIKRVTFLQEIYTALAPTLPESSAGHVGIADYHDGELLIIVDNGAWATRLRYQQEQMRRMLAQKMRLDLDRIEIRVRPAVNYTQPAPQIKRELSATARRQLGETARYIDDANLAAALTRLSRCGQP